MSRKMSSLAGDVQVKCLLARTPFTLGQPLSRREEGRGGRRKGEGRQSAPPGPPSHRVASRLLNKASRLTTHRVIDRRVDDRVVEYARKRVAVDICRCDEVCKQAETHTHTHSAHACTCQIQSSVECRASNLNDCLHGLRCNSAADSEASTRGAHQSWSRAARRRYMFCQRTRWEWAGWACRRPLHRPPRSRAPTGWLPWGT